MENQILELLIRHRRALHRIPEPGHREHQTQAYIMDVLRPLAPDTLIPCAGTGVKVVFLAKNGAQKTLGFRSDIDALPLTEETKLPFASANSGYMHACGHDAHMALLLTFLQQVASMREQMKVNVVGLFQPAEENYLGAADMIADGALENPHIDEIYGGHVAPFYEKGVIAASQGAVMAGNISVDLTIQGKASHGASPQNGIDGILAAASVISAIQMRMTRLCPTDPALVSFGTIHGGEIRNGLAEEVKLTGIIRYYNAAMRDTILELLRTTAENTAAAYGAKAIFTRDQKEYPPVINAALPAQKAQRLIPSVTAQAPQMIAEDFACYLNERPGLFAFIGTGEDGRRAPLHSTTFDLDESALEPMVDFYTKLLLD